MNFEGRKAGDCDVHLSFYVVVFNADMLCGCRETCRRFDERKATLALRMNTTSSRILVGVFTGYMASG